MGDSNFSIGEIRLVTASFMALVIINGMLFGTGIFGDQLTEEPPRLNSTGQNIVTAGEFPESPGSPGQGTLEWDGQNSQVGESLEYAQQSDQDRLTVEVQNVTSQFQVVVTNFEGDGSGGYTVASVDEYQITNEGQMIRHDNTSGGEQWVIEFEVTDLNNYRQPDMNATVEWEIIHSTSGSGGFGSIPVIGGLLSAGDAVAQGLGYLGLIIRWFFAVVFETILGVVLTIADLLTFLMDLAFYLIDGWIKITNAVNQVSPYLSLLLWGPQLPLYFILFNALMKVLKVLPTT